MAITPEALFSGALAIADLLGIGANVDTVAIFDGQSLGQLFADARPLKALVKETSKVMEHPAETGVTLSDHHIINQVEIEITMMISSDSYNSTYQQIRQAFFDSTLLSVQTRTAVYPNMIIADLPHDESAEIYDAVVIGLHLKQVLFLPATDSYDPVQPDDPGSLPPDTAASVQDTVPRGQQQTSSFGGATGSWDSGATGAW